MKRSSVVLGCVVSVVTVSTACGSRAPLDFELYNNSSLSALDGATVGPDGAVNPDPDGGVGPRKDTGPDGNPLVNCGSCVATQCGPTVLTCVTNTGCRDVLQCAMLNCLQGGLDPTCLFKCASGNPGGALQAAGVIQCVTTNCGDSCLSAFGGIGGGIGGGGGGGGRMPESSNLEERQVQRDAVCEMMSPWNELTCSAEQKMIIQ